MHFGGRIESPQPFDGLPALCFSQAQLVKILKIQPELWTRAEEMSQAEGSVTSDRPLPVENSGHPVRGDIQSPRQFGGAHVQLVKFLNQVLAWMNGLARHDVHPQ